MKERLTGAIILVALIVLLVPELLTGPVRSAPPVGRARLHGGTAITLLHHRRCGERRPHARRRRSPPSAAPQPAPVPAPEAAAGARAAAPRRRRTPQRAAPTPPPTAGSARSRPERAAAPAPPASPAAWTVQLGSFSVRGQRRAPGAEAEEAGVRRERLAGHRRGGTCIGCASVPCPTARPPTQLQAKAAGRRATAVRSCRSTRERAREARLRHPERSLVQSAPRATERGHERLR